MASIISLKLSNIKSLGYKNLQEWMDDSNNIFVDDKGYILIEDKGKYSMFKYDGSKWKNPYSLSKYDVNKSLQLYVIHLFTSNLIHKINELRGKNLGTFEDCSNSVVPSCHAQILINLIGKCSTIYGNIRQSHRNKVKLVPSVYKKRNQIGDFTWMIKQPEYEDSLFIFNDNEHDFLKKQRTMGGGNAVIRPYQHQDYVGVIRSTGISTGNLVGYKSLTDGNAKKIIDMGMIRLQKLLDTGLYKRVFYSSDSSGNLGTGIFNVGNDVKQYIISELRRIVV